MLRKTSKHIRIGVLVKTASAFLIICAGLLVVSQVVCYANNPPVLSAIGNKAISVDYTLSFAVSATDPDPATTLTYYASPLPTGASFNSATRKFTWTPVYSQIGNYTITFSVSDGLASDSETINIKVGKSAYNFISEAIAPNFKAGNTLIRLSQCGWNLQLNVQKELCERWDYLMDIAAGPKGEWLTNPGSPTYYRVQEHLKNPELYPVSVYTRRILQNGPEAEKVLPEETWCHDPNGTRIGWISWGNPNWRVKPYISDVIAEAIGNTEIERLQAMKNMGIKVDMILNAAEYDITVPGWGGTMWRQDPVVSKWIDSLTDQVAGFGGNKGKEEQAVRDACLSIYPNIPFILYGTGDTQKGIVNEASRIAWAWPYTYMHNGSTMPSWQFYYGSGGDGYWNTIPKLATNSVAQGIEDGQPLMYNWLCAGWSLTDPNNNSPDDRYTGFLKFLYTLGCVGNNAGYYTYPAPGFEGDPVDSAPDWLRQQMILSHVHAEFTHLEDYLRNGDLLTGNANHVYSYDLYDKVSWMHPSYEFTTNEHNRDAHVVARKHRSKDAWLICAWAALGNDRNVTVTIPGLGELTLLARAAGTLYIATPDSLIILDEKDSMKPSLELHVITTTAGAGGIIEAKHSNSVPDGKSETFNFIPDPGYVVDTITVDGGSVTVNNSYTFTNVTTDHTLAVNFRPSTEKYSLTVQTNPVGISVLDNGETKTTPYTTVALPINTKVVLTAPAIATVGTQKYLFQYWVINGNNQSVNKTTAKFNIAENTTLQAVYVLAVTPPTATPQSVTLNEDSSYDIILTGTDAYGAPLTYTIVTNPTKGTLRKSMTETNYFTYVPGVNYNGPDSFTFKASNGITLSTTAATVSITVLPVNDTPKANDKSISLMMNTSSSIILTATDIDKNPLTYEIVTQPVHGTLSGTTETRTYTPTTGYVGTDSFTFKAFDGTAYSNTATVKLNIKTSNTAPVASTLWISGISGKYIGIDLSKAAYDADGDSLIYTRLTFPTGAGTLAESPGSPTIGLYSGGNTGVFSFDFKVNDNIADSNISTVTIVLRTQNSAPVAISQNLNVQAGVANAVTLQATDADTNPCDILTYTITTSPSHGTITGTAPNIYYTPTTGYSGQDYFIFKAYDGQAYSSLATITLNIGTNNIAPVANNQSLDIRKNALTGIILTATDANNDALTYSIVTQPTHGTLSGTAPNIFYTPVTNYTGPDSFTFKAYDGKAYSNNATISINIISTNNPPVLSAIGNKSVNEGSTLTINLSATDPDGDTLMYTVTGNPAGSSLAGNVFSWTPDYTRAGIYNNVVFTVSDGSLTDSETISITVNNVNRIPSANNQSVSTNKNTAKAITLSATDPDNDALTYSLVTSPAHGTITGSGSARTYTPTLNYTGPDTFTFKANDGTVDSNIATVSITVNNTNSAPVLGLIGNKSVNEGSTLTINLSATDPDGDTLMYTVTGNPAGSSLAGNVFSWTPDYTKAGIYNNVVFTVSDGSLTDSETISITVNNVNRIPSANNQSVSTNKNTAKAITLSATDPDNDTLTYSLVTSPAHGAITGSGSARTYTPTLNYTGSDTFTFKANDGTVDSNIATVSITVNNTTNNNPPVVGDHTVLVYQDTAKTIILSGRDSDHDPLTYYVVAQPTHGTLSGTMPNLIYTPDIGYIGDDLFTFKANDGMADSNIATIYIEVATNNNINHPPVANNQSVSTNKNTAKAITLSATDPDGNALTYALTTSPAHGVITGSGANRTYTPNTNYYGTDLFTFKANDGTLDSNIATVSITVNNTTNNNPPVVGDHTVLVYQDTAKTIILSGRDSDHDPLTYYVVAQPTHGTLSGTMPNLIYTPDIGYIGDDLFTFKANDGMADSNIATIYIGVTASNMTGNHAPIVGDHTVLVYQDTAKTIILSGRDSDRDPLTYYVVAQPIHGVLSGTMPNLIYTPDAGYLGEDLFTFKANDGTSDSNIATIYIGVTLDVATAKGKPSKK